MAVIERERKTLLSHSLITSKDAENKQANIS
jgi:hypothetical protein